MYNFFNAQPYKHDWESYFTKLLINYFFIIKMEYNKFAYFVFYIIFYHLL